MATQVKRYDSLDPSQWMTSTFGRNAEGFFVGRAIVTSIGVFTYKHEDGSIQRELRLPEEVFDSASLESMKLKPLTNDHPKEKVTSQNVQKLSVGTLGSNPSSTNQEKTWDGYTPLDKLTDGLHVAIDMTITHEDAIEDVVNGKRALSMGYECEIEPTSGVWCGMAYDCIQRKIRYNHCALVDGARAGDAARIRLDASNFDIHLDSGDAVYVNITSGVSRGDQAIDQEEKTMKFRLDNGMEFDAPEGFVQAYVSMKEKADAATARADAAEKANTDSKDALSKLEAERDTEKARADKAEKELKEAQDALNDPKRIDAAIEAKIALLDAAKTAGVEVKGDMSEEAIQRAVILSVFPDTKLDGKDKVYISARFDATVELLQKRADGKSRVVAGDNFQGQQHRDSATAHNEMVNKLYNLSNNIEED